MEISTIVFYNDTSVFGFEFQEFHYFASKPRTKKHSQTEKLKPLSSKMKSKKSFFFRFLIKNTVVFGQLGGLIIFYLAFSPKAYAGNCTSALGCDCFGGANANKPAFMCGNPNRVLPPLHLIEGSHINQSQTSATAGVAVTSTEEKKGGTAANPVTSGTFLAGASSSTQRVGRFDSDISVEASQDKIAVQNALASQQFSYRTGHFQSDVFNEDFLPDADGSPKSSVEIMSAVVQSRVPGKDYYHTQCATYGQERDTSTVGLEWRELEKEAEILKAQADLNPKNTVLQNKFHQKDKEAEEKFQVNHSKLEKRETERTRLVTEGSKIISDDFDDLNTKFLQNQKGKKKKKYKVPKAQMIPTNSATRNPSRVDPARVHSLREMKTNNYSEEQRAALKVLTLKAKTVNLDEQFGFTTRVNQNAAKLFNSFQNPQDKNRVIRCLNYLHSFCDEGQPDARTFLHNRKELANIANFEGVTRSGKKISFETACFVALSTNNDWREHVGIKLKDFLFSFNSKLDKKFLEDCAVTLPHEFATADPIKCRSAVHHQVHREVGGANSYSNGWVYSYPTHGHSHGINEMVRLAIHDKGGIPHNRGMFTRGMRVYCSLLNNTPLQPDINIDSDCPGTP